MACKRNESKKMTLTKNHPTYYSLVTTLQAEREHSDTQFYYYYKVGY